MFIEPIKTLTCSATAVSVASQSVAFNLSSIIICSVSLLSDFFNASLHNVRLKLGYQFKLCCYSPDSVLIIDAGLETGQTEAHSEAGVVWVHEAVVVNPAVVAEPHGDAHLGLGLGDMLEDVDGL